MSFCKYCGQQLSDGQQCNCKGSQAYRKKVFERQQEELRRQYYAQQKQQQQQQMEINNINTVPPSANFSSGNAQAAISDLWTNIKSILKNPIAVIKNISAEGLIKKPLILTAICFAIVLVESIISLLIARGKADGFIAEYIYEQASGAAIKTVFVSLIVYFLWGLLIAAVMVMTSNAFFHEHITYVQAYSVVAVKTLVGTILGTACAIIGILIPVLGVILTVPVYILTVMIFIIGYYELLSRNSSVRMYEIFLMYIIMFFVFMIFTIIIAFIIGASVSSMIGNMF